ncbi:MAG: DUF3370 domain-containing protein, partial [Cyanobacteria bacterium]|nr:DUF3370 domain-containing protein [Cyanobacteriota bacterium]
TFGTDQEQSAPLAVRNADTAYAAHGNYGVKYDLVFPLKNLSGRKMRLNFSLETPIKSDVKSAEATFSSPPFDNVHFRGTIKAAAKGSQDTPDETKYFHIVQRRGEMGIPFLSLPMKPEEEATVHVEFFYPPDCTPPQFLTLSTAAE